MEKLYARFGRSGKHANPAHFEPAHLRREPIWVWPFDMYSIRAIVWLAQPSPMLAMGQIKVNKTQNNKINVKVFKIFYKMKFYLKYS